MDDLYIWLRKDLSGVCVGPAHARAFMHAQGHIVWLSSAAVPLVVLLQAAAGSRSCPPQALPPACTHECISQQPAASLKRTREGDHGRVFRDGVNEWPSSRQCLCLCLCVCACACACAATPKLADKLPEDHPNKLTCRHPYRPASSGGSASDGTKAATSLRVRRTRSSHGLSPT